jgi:AraC-like DNA-binding protein
VTTISLAPVNIIHVIYTTIAIFSIFLLFGKKTYKALLLLLLAHAIQEFFNIFEELGVTNHLITPAIQLALGPLYYLFAKNLIYGDLNVRQHSIHLIPAFIAIGFTAWWPMLLKIAFVLLICYFFLTFRLLRHYHNVLVEITADDDNHALTWLTRTLIVIFVLELVDFTRLNLQLYLNIDLLVNWYFISALTSLTYTTYLVLRAIRQPVLYSGIVDFEKNVAGKTTLEDSDEEIEQAASIFQAIAQYLNQTGAYRQPKYSLRNLAEDMGLTEQMISWAINQGGGKSFSGYINGLRIEEVKQSLSEKTNSINILDTAFKAGFSSKSTFNAVFKRNTGMTPSQYTKRD